MFLSILDKIEIKEKHMEMAGMHFFGEGNSLFK